jgi:enoyl-CoA hydratase/carnithine racemase
METAQLFESERDSALLRIRLVGPRGHALRIPGLRQLADLVESAAAHGAPPLLLEADGRSFCTGLDLDAASQLDRAELRELMREFHRAMRAVFLYRGGSVAAVGGHALAGGAILALACDSRVVAEGAGRLGIHGVRLGIAYPDVAVEIVRRRFSRRHAEQILYAGETLAAEEAPGLGWADALASRQALELNARQRLESMGAGSATFARNKGQMLQDATARLAAVDSDGEERFLDVWFSGETQTLLAERKLR